MRKIYSFVALFIGLQWIALAKTDTVQVHSDAMDKDVPNLIITPSGYSSDASYPSVYLLHGAGGDYTSWARIADLQQYADRYGLIIVCPDAGVTSWYFDSPIDPKMQYETYVAMELVHWVDQHYATKRNPDFRAITGLSMGGHGGLYLGFRHQDVWRAVGSISGGVDIRPFPLNWDIDKRLGSYAECKETWEENTVINMLHLLDGKTLDIIIDCGRHDFFYEANVRLHDKLEDRNIPHDFISRPGVHNAEYWHNSIAYHLMFFNGKFEARK
ncbi:esterase family protein [Echinicola soli]|uniref:Esterase family protein n=1 Tax=Echinicola soli TaxID=2591634 RepID=A0A514CF28_9BACT|nr:alpha/beta hydrolase family protein [Echinicola soli]QDH78445.1 esterase family protein [Echinicola soli]